jgi:hypothetical protein
MLMAEDPGAASAYPCFISTYKRTTLPTEIVSGPRRVKYKNGTAYTVLIHGVLYYFFITHKMNEPWILESALSDQGELRLVLMPEENGKRLLNTFFGKKVFI